MRITIIGCGYVGLTTSVALAYLGHHIHCIDQNQHRIHSLQQGIVPIHETGVAELLTQLRHNLTFGTWDTFTDNSQVIIIAVGTPPKADGDADLTYVENVAQELGDRLTQSTLPVIVNKSTVPIGSARRLESIIEQHTKTRQNQPQIMVASNPEFLREGVALADTFYPDRIVVGANHPRAAQILQEMYAPILEQSFQPPQTLPRPAGYTKPEYVVTTPTSAELIKYASNTFLAMKISFINEMAGLAEKVGADIKEVARGMGLDQRIGHQYLGAGLGWGGSCFGKDIHALIHTARQYDYHTPLSQATIQVNLRQREEVIKKLQSALKVLRGNTVGILGLAFKPGTDDLRDAPAITVINRLLELGAHVKAYDPVAMANCQQTYPDLNIHYAADPQELAQGLDALVLVTEWQQFKQLPYQQMGDTMRQKIIIDGRNLLDKLTLESQGFTYIGMGR